MKKLLVFTGESGSGKTTLIARLTGEYSNRFRKVVTCTSRPRRVGEIDGADYHFLPPEYFIDNPDLVLTKRTSDGFYYGTRRSDLTSDTHHLLLTSKLTGVQKLVGWGFPNIILVRISISDELKLERMRQRGDGEEMISTRLLSDVKDRTEVDLSQVQIIDLDAIQEINDKVHLIVGRVDD